MKYIGIITLLVLCLALLLLTGCMINTVTPEISMGNSNNPNSNNYQDSSTDPVEEPATEEQTTNPSSNNPNSNNYQNPSTDPVEEQATEEPGTVEVDTTKPVITGSRAPLPNSFGWNNTDVSVSFSCADTGPVQSGIDVNTVAGATVTTEGKDQSVTNTGTCIDAAGNVADPVTVFNINIDKTPPEVTITLPGTGEYVLNQSITATWSATDALSGVVSPVSGTVSIDTSSVGTKTFTLPAGTAMDKAGNSSLKVTKSYSVIADTEDPEMIYPQQWATGDGTVENPWANDCIKKAYDFVLDGGTIYLRAGYYQLNGKLTISKSINMVGEGMNKTIIKTADAVGLSINTDYVSIKNLTIDGDAQTDNTQYLAPIELRAGIDYALLEDIEVKNAGYYGMNIYGVNHSLFQNIYAHDNYRHGLHPGADAVGRNKYNTYRDIYAWNNGVSGFDDRGSSDVDAEKYNIYDNLQCWDNGSHGIVIGYQRSCVLSNSFASGNGADGIWLYDIEDFNIHDCSTTLNDKQGLKISLSSKNVNLTNVIVKNNNVSDTNYSGIRVENSSGIKFTSCQSYDDRATLIQEYGIRIVGAVDFIEIINCILTPNEKSSICNDAGAVIIEEIKLARF